MITPAFMIFSASRSGSTSLCRAFNLMPATWVAYEPGFEGVPHREDAVQDYITGWLADHSGFKHVFDPAGNPFRRADWLSAEETERDCPLWIRLNSALLNYPGLHIIFLRRRDGFHRVVSDHLARATDHGYWNGLPASDDDAAHYRKEVSRLPLPPLDENLVRWYLEHLPPIQDELRASIKTNEVLDLWYEDLFGPGVTMFERIERFREIVRFVGIEAPPRVFESGELPIILWPSAKLNDAGVFERIPNYLALRSRFGIAGSPVGVKDGPDAPLVSNRENSRNAGSPAWRLRSHGANVAGVTFPTGEPDRVRVSIMRVAAGVPHDVQLNLAPFDVAAELSYRLQFQARSGVSRKMSFGVAQAHEPWLGLGLYEEVDLSPEWRSFDREFTASASDDRTRVHFDLGGHDGTVELSNVRLLAGPSRG